MSCSQKQLSLRFNSRPFHFTKSDQESIPNTKNNQTYQSYREFVPKWFKLCQNISEQLFEDMKKFIELNMDSIIQAKKGNLEKITTFSSLLENCIILVEFKKNYPKLSLQKIYKQNYFFLRKSYATIRRRIIKLNKLFKFRRNFFIKQLKQLLKCFKRSLKQNKEEHLKLQDLQQLDQKNIHHQFFQRLIPKKISFWTAFAQIIRTIPFDKMSVEQLKQFQKQALTQTSLFSQQVSLNKYLICLRKSDQKQSCQFQQEKANQMYIMLEDKMKTKKQAYKITMFIQQVLSQKVINLIITYIDKVQKVLQNIDQRQKGCLEPKKQNLYKDCIIMLKAKQNHLKLKFSEVIQLISKLINKSQGYVMRRFYSLAKLSQQSLLFHLQNVIDFGKNKDIISASQNLTKKKNEKWNIISNPQKINQGFQFSFGDDIQSQNSKSIIYETFQIQINSSKELQSQIVEAEKRDLFDRQFTETNDPTPSFISEGNSELQNSNDLKEIYCPYQSTQLQSKEQKMPLQIKNQQIQDQSIIFFFNKLYPLTKVFNSKIQNKTSKRSSKILHFIKNTLNEEIIETAKKFIIDNKTKFDYYLIKKNQRSSYKHYEDCLLLVMVKQMYPQYSISQIFKYITSLTKRSWRSYETRFYYFTKLNDQQILKNIKNQIQFSGLYKTNKNSRFLNNNLPQQIESKQKQQNKQHQTAFDHVQQVMQDYQHKKNIIQKLSQQHRINKLHIHQAQSDYEQNILEKKELSQIKVENIEDIEKTDIKNKEITVQVQDMKNMINPAKSLKFQNLHIQESSILKSPTNSFKFINSKQFIKKQNNLSEDFQDCPKQLLKDFYDEKQTKSYSFGEAEHQDIQKSKKQIKLYKISQKENEFLAKKRLKESDFPPQYQLLAQVKLKQISNQMRIRFQINLNNEMQQTLATQDQCIQSIEGNLEKVIKFYVVKKQSYEPKLKSEATKTVKIEVPNSTIQ